MIPQVGIAVLVAGGLLLGACQEPKPQMTPKPPDKISTDVITKTIDGRKIICVITALGGISCDWNPPPVGGLG